MQAQIVNGINADKVSVDLRISVLKPLHAKRVTQFYDYMQVNKEIIIKGWERSGIGAVLKETQRKEDSFEYWKYSNKHFPLCIRYFMYTFTPCLCHALYYDNIVFVLFWKVREIKT